MLRVYSHVRLETIRRELEPFWQSHAKRDALVNALEHREQNEHLNTLNVNMNVNTVNAPELTN
jgi:hypothetical protein